MATEILRPNSDVSVGCLYVGSSSRYANVDEAVPSDADYNYSLGQIEREDTLGLATMAGDGAVTNVSLRTRLSVDYLDGLEYAKPKIVVSGTNYYGATRGAGSGIGEYVDNWATNPAGGSWTREAINALRVGYALKGGNDPKEGDSAAVVYQQYVVVTYSPARSFGAVIG